MFNNLLQDKLFYSKLKTLALPITLQSLMLSLVAAADALMLGRLDQDSMAAVSLATQVQFVQTMILQAIIAGTAILGAQYWGKGDKTAIDRIFGISVRQSLLVSIVFFGGCFFMPDTLMRLFANDPTLIDIGSKYLKIASWSYLITGLSQCYLGIMKVSEHATCSAWISSGAVILNIVLNALFIFGCGGLEPMGAEGAALATVIARMAELGCCIGLSSQKTFIQLKIKTVVTYHRQLVLDFIWATLPIWGSYLLWGVGFTTYTAIMGHLGKDAAAANAVQAVARDIMCCLCNGVAAAGGIIVGNELGAGNLEKAKTYGDRLSILSIVIGLFSMAVILATIPLVLNTLKLTENAQALLVGMFAIMAVYMIGRCINTIVLNGVLYAGGDTLFDTYSLIVTMWLIAIPCAFAAAFWLKLHVLVVFSCTCLDEVGKLPWVYHHYRKYKWVKNLTRDFGNQESGDRG